MADFIELLPADADALTKMIADWCGIVIDDRGSVMLEFRMHPVLSKYKCSSFREFLTLAKRGDQRMRDDVIDAVTTNETLWFRDGHLYENLLESILPTAITKARAAGRSGIKIWSAAASTGQEGYSISMLLHEISRRGQLTHGELAACKIIGTDISKAALEVARRGSYDPISMGRGMWPGYEDKYFDKTARSATIKPDVAKMVEFQQRNLLDSFFGLNGFDVVLIRNVLIYFSPEVKTDILTRIGQTMNPEAMLVVGSCEDATRYSKDYATCRIGRTMYYEVKQAS